MIWEQSFRKFSKDAGLRSGAAEMQAALFFTPFLFCNTQTLKTRIPAWGISLFPGWL